MTPQFNKYIYRIMYGHLQPDKGYIQNQNKRAFKLCQYLKSNDVDVSSIQSVLDIGCSAGGILDYFKSKGVKRLVGIEPHIEFSGFAKSKGFEIFTGTLETWDSKDKFDLIIMRDVSQLLIDIEYIIDCGNRLLYQ